jgi:hypothetical protein
MRRHDHDTYPRSAGNVARSHHAVLDTTESAHCRCMMTETVMDGLEKYLRRTT